MAKQAPDTDKGRDTGFERGIVVGARWAGLSISKTADLLGNIILLTVIYHGKRVLKWRLLSCVSRDFPSFDFLSSKAWSKPVK